LLEKITPVKYAVYIIQGLLAALFVFAGVMKLITPIEAMTQQMAMPGWFIRFIGVCELLGGLGLVLPDLLQTRRGLVALAALGLLLIMAGAIVVTLMSPSPAQAAIPAFVALLLGFLIYARRRLSRAPAAQ
jgi:hypothetical protein